MEQAGFTLKLNDHGQVVLINSNGTIPLGPKDQSCEELCRFLSEIDFEGC